VNEYLQSRTNALVYAAGDSADGGGLPLSPVAGAEGDLIARNLLDGNRYTIDFSGLASMVYSVPALGKAGLTEEQARSRGLRFTVHEGDSTEWYSSRRVRVRRAAYRVLVEDQTNHVLGAHILGPHAEEVVNVFSLAIQERIPATRLRSVLFAYPTGSSDIEYMVE
jgi:glutathione reductase (NADPH)